MQKTGSAEFIGTLNWAARVIRGGRTFLCRLIDLSKTMKQNNHSCWLNKESRADLRWWSMCLKIFNGTAVFVQDMKPPSSELMTDACRKGGGGIYKHHWFYINFHSDYPEFENSHINCLELVTVLEAAKRWGHMWSGQHIRVYSDNMATVQSINKGTSLSTEFMTCLRSLFWLSVKHGFRLTASHVPGVHNEIADLISRLHTPYFANKFLSYMGNNRVNCFYNMSYKTFLILQEVHLMQTPYNER